jgi:phasin family protein
MMIQQFDSLQKLGKDHMDATLKTLGTVSKGAQAIAVEVADYSKKSFEQSTATLEKLVGARTLEKALEIQTDYLKSSYETLVAQSSKLGEIYANLAKEAYKPYETLFAQAQATTQANVQAATRQAKAA